MEGARSGIVVGIDGSGQSLRAIDWAVDEAAPDHVPLTVVHVVEPRPIGDALLGHELDAIAHRHGQQLVDAAVARVSSCADEVPIGGRVLSGNPAEELIELAMRVQAQQIVLGCRGVGGFATLLLGSVAAQVAAHAPCTTVVVRGLTGTGGPVTVGVDGSERDSGALEVGFGHAARHGIGLQAVHAYPDLLMLPPYPMRPVDLEDLRASADRSAQGALDAWAGKYPGVLADPVAAAGGAAHCLIDASQGSSLLVVGCRGQIRFAGPGTGSVSQAALRHAPCPVAVTR